MSADSVFRIVSLVPSITETLCDLGLQSSVVGCTSFCVHPKSLRHTAVSVGGTKDANYEKIMSLAPSHVLADVEENDGKLLEKLQKASVEVIVYFPVEVSDALDLVVDIAKRFGRNDEGNAWHTTACRELENCKMHTTTPLSYSYFIWREPWMVAGDKTFISKMLATVGFQNSFVTGELPRERYPEVAARDARLSNSEILMFSSEPFPFKQRHIDQFLYESGMKARTLKVDGQLLSWYGTRTLEGLRYIQQLRKELEC